MVVCCCSSIHGARYQLSDSSLILRASLPWRQILPIEDAKEQGGKAWLQVRCGPDCRGWVVRELPAPEAGYHAPRSRVIWLTIRYRDFFSMLAGFAGLLWGYASFRIRPA